MIQIALWHVMKCYHPMKIAEQFSNYDDHRDEIILF